MEALFELVSEQRELVRSGATKPLSARKAALKTLVRMMEERGDLLAEAISRDLGRCWLESWSAEPGLVLADARSALRHLAAWSRDTRYRLSPAMLPGRVAGRREPFGTAVIIGPWNYPAGLLFCPMVSALAGGNTVILKPSQRAPATAEAVFRIVDEYFPRNLAAVVRGGGDEARWLIGNASDIVCFTGSGPTGSMVMREAAAKPVPVILELGGCNPCFVAGDAPLREAARRIAWGKFFGAGQTCLAPNHVFVHRSVMDGFQREMARAVKEFYGDDPFESPHYGRIIDREAWERLCAMMSEGKPVTGGDADRDTLYIAPTVLSDVGSDSRLIEEEVFGPILPVLPSDSIEGEIERFGRGVSSPLAVYGFSRRSRMIEKLLLERTRSGSVVVNGTLHRIVSSSVAFGGVGGSGMGRYRGREGFLNFTWERAVLRKNPKLEMPVLYPPYRIGRRFVRMFSRFL